MSEALVRQTSGSGTLNAEHYQTFEMAKANDGILGGDDIAQIRSYAAFARAQAQAIHKSIANMGEFEDVAQAKAEMNETSQTFAKVSVYADQRIGEILRELPTKQGARNDITSVGTPTKVEAEKQANIDHHTSIDLQKMADNPEVVEAVIAKAEAEGRIVSRSQVLKAIKERDAERKRAEQAERDRDITRHNLEDLYRNNAALESENNNLRKQLEEMPEPKVTEREVVREVESEKSKSELREANRLKDLYLKDCQKLRERNQDMSKELDRAREILGMDETMREVQRDAQYLVTATNQYMRHYGGLTWTVESLSEVDKHTLEELRRAVLNMGTFANRLIDYLEDFIND